MSATTISEYDAQLKIAEIIESTEEGTERSYALLYFFMSEVFEIAFGDDAINKYYTIEDVLKKLKEHAELSWQYEELCK